VTDSRDRRGRRHSLPSVLALVQAAVTSGATTFAGIIHWIGTTPEHVLADCRVWFSRRRNRRVPPKTLIAILEGLDAAEMDAAYARQRSAQMNGELIGLAVDGKAQRGTADKRARTRARHRMGAFLHADAIMLAQVDVDGKSNEVRHEALCRIPRVVRRNSEGNSWVRWLTWIRKVKGTGACHEYRRSCSDVRGGASGGPRDMAKAVLPESQSPVMQVFIHRKRHLEPVLCSASGYLVTGVPSGARAMSSEGIQGDEWGA